jgi:hypothetical protein
MLQTSAAMTANAAKVPIIQAIELRGCRWSGPLGGELLGSDSEVSVAGVTHGLTPVGAANRTRGQAGCSATASL